MIDVYWFSRCREQLLTLVLLVSIYLEVSIPSFEAAIITDAMFIFTISPQTILN